MVTIFKEVLAKHYVPAKETQELLDIVGSTKADMVAFLGRQVKGTESRFTARRDHGRNVRKP